VIKLERNGDSTRSLTSAVRERLRADIVACRIVPGEKLHIARLASRYGVSVGAVREALSRLVSEGWVQAEDQRGFQASPVSVEDLHDITRARIEIEGIALHRSIEFGDAQWEARVRLAYRELSEAPLPAPSEHGAVLDAWRTAHAKFHAALVAGCDSQWLLRFRQTLYEQSERYRILSYRVKPRDLATEHRAIAEATLARDAESAVKALSQHFTVTAEAMLEGLVSGGRRRSQGADGVATLSRHRAARPHTSPRERLPRRRSWQKRT